MACNHSASQLALPFILCEWSHSFPWPSQHPSLHNERWTIHCWQRISGWLGLILGSPHVSTLLGRIGTCSQFPAQQENQESYNKSALDGCVEIVQSGLISVIKIMPWLCFSLNYATELWNVFCDQSEFINYLSITVEYVPFLIFWEIILSVLCTDNIKLMFQSSGLELNQQSQSMWL